MINLKTFFINHFNTNKISDANLRKFAQTHINRLLANGGTIYTPLIAPTQAAFTAFANAIDAEDFAIAVKQGRTVAVDDAIINFKTTISQKEGTIKGLWGVNSAQYQAFFPLGLSEYSNANKADMEMLMTRVVSASTLYTAELGLPFITLFTNLKLVYTAARTAQLGKIGEVEVDKTITENTRNVLTTILMKNLLVIASNNVGNTNMLEDFFDQSFIRSTTAPDDGSITANIAPNSTVNIESMGITLASEFTLINTGTVPLKFGIETSATAEVLVGLLVLPGATLQANYLQLLGANAPGSTYFNVSNNSPLPGAYSVLIE